MLLASFLLYYYTRCPDTNDLFFFIRQLVGHSISHCFCNEMTMKWCVILVIKVGLSLKLLRERF